LHKKKQKQRLLLPLNPLLPKLLNRLQMTLPIKQQV
jgi:hypothetical protein